jgi:phosphatidate cytidylyltransferase
MKNSTRSLIQRGCTAFILSTLTVFCYTQLTTPLVTAILALIGVYVLLIEWPQFNRYGLTPIYPLMGMVSILVLNQKTSILPYILIIVVSTDTLAYMVGRSLGKRYLAPAISPKKTWEGFIAGLLGSCIVGVITAPYFNLQMNIRLGLFIILLSLSATLGDLFESYLKRRSHLKDSGTLLPGHGGVLDRIDSLLFAAPVGYIFYRVFGL